MSHPSAEDTKKAYFRITYVVQDFGAQLDESHDFQFEFSKPRPAEVCFARDAVCTATCYAEISIAIAEKLAKPLKDDVAALGSLGSSRASGNR